MQGNDFLDGIDKSTRPEPNIEGDFDCFECREPVSKAYYDKNESILYWWCSSDHESYIKGFNL